MALNDQERVEKLGAAADFMKRYKDGAPEDGISGDEALNNFQAVLPKVSGGELQSITEEAFGNLSGEQRQHLGNMIQQRSGGQFNNVDLSDPKEFAQVASNFRSDSGSGIAGLLGLGGVADPSQAEGGGGLLSGLLGGLLGGGNDNAAAQNTQTQGLESLISNPIVRALLGGIAAIAMQRILGGAAGKSGGGIEDIIGSLIGGGGSSSSGGSSGSNAISGGGLDDLLGGLIGGGSGKSGGGIQDIFGGLIGGGNQGDTNPSTPKTPGNHSKNEI